MQLTLTCALQLCSHLVDHCVERRSSLRLDNGPQLALVTSVEAVRICDVEVEKRGRARVAEVDEVDSLALRLADDNPLAILEALLANPDCDDFVMFDKKWAAKLPNWRQHQWERRAVRPGEQKGAAGAGFKKRQRQSLVAFTDSDSYDEERVSAAFRRWGSSISIGMKRVVPNFLTRCDGKYSASKQQEWMKVRAKQRLSENDPSEALFATAKACKQVSSSLGDAALDGSAMARNGRYFGVRSTPPKLKGAKAARQHHDGQARQISSVAWGALIAVARAEPEVQKARALRKRQDEHEAAARQKKRDKKDAADRKKAAAAAYYFNIRRATTAAALDRLIARRSAASAKEKVLLEQTYHRTIGCGHK